MRGNKGVRLMMMLALMPSAFSPDLAADTSALYFLLMVGWLPVSWNVS